MSLHLVPAGEVDLHELHIACVCLPVFGPQRRPDGRYGQLVAHRIIGQDQDEELVKE